MTICDHSNWNVKHFVYIKILREVDAFLVGSSSGSSSSVTSASSSSPDSGAARRSPLPENPLNPRHPHDYSRETAASRQFPFLDRLCGAKVESLRLTHVDERNVVSLTTVLEAIMRGGGLKV